MSDKSEKLSKNRVQAVYLHINGKTKKTFDIDPDDIQFDKFPDEVKKYKGYGNIERECDYSFDDDTIVLLAFDKGKEKYINKWELPPPVDSDIYYGNIICIRLDSDKNPLSMDIDYFDKFYEKAFGGFENLSDTDDEEESDDDEPTQSDIDFIVDDDEEEDESDDDDDNDDEEEEYESESDSDMDEEDKLKEQNLIDEYLENINKSLLKIPYKIKNLIYKHHMKNNDFLFERLEKLEMNKYIKYLR